MFRSVHGPIVDEMFKTARPKGGGSRCEAYRFDALIEMARRCPTGTGCESGSDTGADRQEKQAKRTPARHLAIVRVDLEALRRGEVEGDELCEITGLGPIPIRTARETPWGRDRESRDHQRGRCR